MLVTDASHYDKLLRDLTYVSNKKMPVAVDTETSGLNIYLNDVVRGICIAYTDPDQDNIDSILSWYLPISCPSGPNFDPHPLIEVLNEHKGLQVYHHSVFDFAALKKLDETFEIPVGRFHDTMIKAWLIDENVQHGLKPLASAYFGEDAASEQKKINALKKGRPWKEFYDELREDDEWKSRPAKETKAEAVARADATKKTWETLTAEDIASYAARDAELTLMLMYAQVGPFGSREPALQRELDLQVVLYKMIRNGIKVNLDEAARQTKAATDRLAELEANFSNVNLASPKQVAALLFDEWGLPVLHTTKLGAPSTSKEALEELVGHPGVREIMEVRSLQKALGTYYRPLTNMCASDGRIHAAFSSARTVTGRLSCSSPNLMTIPRGDTLTGVRDLFVTDDGYELWEHDIVSAELFFQADYCRDENLVRALQNGEDLHDLTATMVFGPDFTGLQRRLAKNLNYGFAYGIQPRRFSSYMVAGTTEVATECKYWSRKSHPKLAKFMDSIAKRHYKCGVCHVCQASDILDGYREAYPDLVRFMNNIEKIAKRDGKIPLHVEGRYRHFKSPKLNIPTFTAFNALVQGGVAEFMKDMMLELDGQLEDIGARLCLQVHDSLVTESPLGTGKLVAQMIQQASDRLNPLTTMHIKWDSKPWGEHQ